MTPRTFDAALKVFAACPVALGAIAAWEIFKDKKKERER